MLPLKVVHLNQSDSKGGAAVAAYRLHRSLLSMEIDSEMWVDKKFTDDPSVKLKLNFIERYLRKIASWSSKKFVKSIGIRHSSYFNLGIFGSSWVRYLNSSDADIVHLHWLGNEILSIKQIKKITKPCIVTLHDEWLIGDGFHLKIYGSSPKIRSSVELYVTGYIRKHRVKYYNENLALIAPSKFMASLVDGNSLYSKNKLKIIGHPISETDWHPITKSEAKKSIGIPQQSFSILYSCFGGIEDTNKGFDDFCYAVKQFACSNPEVDLHLVVLGNFTKLEIKKIGLSTVFLGALENRSDLIRAYCASDVAVIPSKYESFGLVAQELLVLGIPIVAYDGTGLTDFVLHKNNGYLAKRFDHTDLAAGLSFWHMNLSSKTFSMRKPALEVYSPARVAESHISFYTEVLSQAK